MKRRAYADLQKIVAFFVSVSLLGPSTAAAGPSQRATVQESAAETRTSNRALVFAQVQDETEAPLAIATADWLRELLRGQSSCVLSAQETREGLKEVFAVPAPLYVAGAFALDPSLLRYHQARRAYYRFAFAECLQRLEPSDPLAVTLSDSPASQFLIPLWRGICHLGLQEKNAALESMAAAIDRAPLLHLRTHDYSPEVVEAFESARRLRDQRGLDRSSAVALVSDPPFARVYWNGNYEGETPLTLLDLPGETALVRLQAADHLDSYARVQPDRAAPTRFVARLEPRPLGLPEISSDGHLPFWLSLNAAVTRGIEQDSGKVELHEWAQILGASEIWILRQEEASEEHRFSIYRFKDSANPASIQIAQVSRTLRKDALQDASVWADLEKEIRSSLAADLQLEATPEALAASSVQSPEARSAESNILLVKPEQHERAHERAAAELAAVPTPKGPAWYKNRWVWIAAGVLVAGGAAATAIALSGGGDSGSSSTGQSSAPPGTVIVGFGK